MVIYGKYTHQLDEKGRVRVPAKIRAALGDNFVVMNGTNRPCLYLLPAAEAERISAKLEDALYGDDEAQDTMRFLFSGIEPGNEDKQGRLQISKDHLKHAGLEKNVITIGVGKRAELWSEKAYAEFEAKIKGGEIGAKSLGKYGV